MKSKNKIKLILSFKILSCVDSCISSSKFFVTNSIQFHVDLFPIFYRFVYAGIPVDFFLRISNPRKTVTHEGIIGGTQICWKIISKAISYRILYCDKIIVDSWWCHVKVKFTNICSGD
jgi:hypothetical protein